MPMRSVTSCASRRGRYPNRLVSRARKSSTKKSGKGSFSGDGGERLTRANGSTAAGKRGTTAQKRAKQAPGLDAEALLWAGGSS